MCKTRTKYCTTVIRQKYQFDTVKDVCDNYKIVKYMYISCFMLLYYLNSVLFIYFVLPFLKLSFLTQRKVCYGVQYLLLFMLYC